MFDWQTILVLCSVTVAALFLAVRGWRVLQTQRAKCQSHCDGCGRDKLVQLADHRAANTSCH
jgi:hypothetical protein